MRLWKRLAKVVDAKLGLAGPPRKADELMSADTPVVGTGLTSRAACIAPVTAYGSQLVQSVSGLTTMEMTNRILPGTWIAMVPRDSAPTSLDEKVR